MKDSKHQPISDWQKTPYANLLRYIPSGTYFARMKVNGKLIRQSLKTTDLMTAKRELNALEGRLRNQGVRNGKMTFAQALELYRGQTRKDADLKPRAKQYREDRIKALLKSWPGLEELEIRKLTPQRCKDWSDEFKPTASASAFNHTLGVLRALIKIGISDGARFDDPSAELERKSEKPKKLTLPEPEQFLAFVAELEKGGSRDSKACAELVQFLAYGGFRIDESRHITWADCDFTKSKIMVRGGADGLKGREAGDSRDVPMIPEMKAMLERMRQSRLDEQDDNPVMRVKECQKSMDRAAQAVKMQRITHHDLRHLFATRCIESGVDIPTVSRWMGHKDGGALAMRIYGHLREQHSVEMAQKVTFATPKNVVRLDQKVA